MRASALRSVRVAEKNIDVGLDRRRARETDRRDRRALRDRPRARDRAAPSAVTPAALVIVAIDWITAVRLEDHDRGVGYAAAIATAVGESLLSESVYSVLC